MSTSLRVSLTQRVLTHNGCRYDSINHGWYAYLSRHSLATIPNRPDQDFLGIIAGCDVLVITGGDRDTTRDMVERELFDAAMRLGRPIVGVCHGLQRLTEMMGGCLEPMDGHHGTAHDVFDHLGDRHTVNSFHNFRISMLPPGVSVLATDMDGNCESWAIGNVSGVMWHPERQPFGWLPGAIAQVLFP